MDISSISNLADKGVVGIAIALIVLLAWVIYWFVKVVSNHIQHNTKIMTKLEGKIDYDIKAQKESTKMMQEVKEYLIKQNGK